MKDEYIFNTTMEYSDESFNPVLEVNSYDFQPNMGDTIISTTITDHGELEGRNNPNQHTISSITDLEVTLSNLATKYELSKKASIKCGTVEYWETNGTYVPEYGELIVYTDYASTTDEQGNLLYIPRVKIGDGIVKVRALPFVGDDLQIMIEAHILNNDVHIRQGEREFWNNKVTTILDEIDDENLIFTTKKINIQYQY